LHFHDRWAFVNDGDKDPMNCSNIDTATGHYGANCTAWAPTQWPPLLRRYAAPVRKNAPGGVPHNNFMETIHVRLKGPVGRRWALAAVNTLAKYRRNATAPAGPVTGPTISGCALDAGAGTLTLAFNETLLAGDTLWVNDASASYSSNKSMWGGHVIDTNGLMVCATPSPAPPRPINASCDTKCVEAGHCCMGDVSSFNQPSCSMGCTIGAATDITSVEECQRTCLAISANHSCDFHWETHNFQLCEVCPNQCKSPNVGECLDGCKFAFGEPIPQPWLEGNETTCGCQSWNFVRCSAWNAWPCSWPRSGDTYWYCEVGEGWKPPQPMRDAAAVLQREIARNASALRVALRDGSGGEVPPLGWAPQPNPFLGLWEPAKVSASTSAATVTVNVAPFAAAERDVLAVRYGWPITDGTGSCCSVTDVMDGLAVCIPGSCPLFAKDSGFPANPFFAAIVDGAEGEEAGMWEVDGHSGAAKKKCRCRAPQVCDA